MTPHLALDDVADRSVRDVVLAGEVRLSFASRFAGADIQHLGIGQLRDGVVLTAQNQLGMSLRSVTIPCRHPAFCLGVSDVFSLGTGNKMLRAHAGADIAGVSNDTSPRQWAEVQLPGEAMRLLLLSIDINLSISLGVFSRCPQPAVWSLTDTLPESYFSRPLPIAVGTRDRTADITPRVRTRELPIALRTGPNGSPGQSGIRPASIRAEFTLALSDKVAPSRESGAALLADTGDVAWGTMFLHSRLLSRLPRRGRSQRRPALVDSPFVPETPFQSVKEILAEMGYTNGNGHG